MKKAISIALLSLGLTGLAVNAAHAAGFAKIEGKNNTDICQVLTYAGAGSNFLSDDGKMDAKLYYNGNNGEGVSGGFGAVVNGLHRTAALTSSSCKNGVVKLKWTKLFFMGEVEGTIDLPNNMIANVTGKINGKAVHGNLIFKDYN